MTDATWSAPARDVIAGIGNVLNGSERGVLATVVDVEGSAYRRPGAKMVVTEDGDGIGHITSGCLEDEVARLATEVLEAGRPRIERYDLREPAEDDVWGLGVGCEGVVDVLLEPVDESFRPVVDAVEAGSDVGVVTVVDGPEASAIGARTLYDPSRETLANPDVLPVDSADVLEGVARRAVEQGAAQTAEVEGYTVFVDGVVAPDDLVVIGTGNDVPPIVDVGRRAGFRVTVLGFRGARATAERFPRADEVRSTTPGQFGTEVAFDEDTYAVLATHNLVDDRIALDHLLDTPVPYVGLMGPRERSADLLDELEAEGRTLDDTDRQRIYAPVGLDLGAESPQQIALSVVSEVLAVRNEREPRHLRERQAPIHDRIESTR